MSLKELTMQQHRNAERQKFARVLMSGEIPKKFYLIVCSLSIETI